MAGNSKPGGDDEKRRQEMTQRQMRYGFTYMIVGLLFLLGAFTFRGMVRLWPKG